MDGKKYDARWIVNGEWVITPCDTIEEAETVCIEYVNKCDDRNAVAQIWWVGVPEKAFVVDSFSIDRMSKPWYMGRKS